MSSHISSRKYQNTNNGSNGGAVVRRHHHHRQQWLKQATDDILQTKPGTLVKGKWHELVSILKANSRYAKVDRDTPAVMEQLIERLVQETTADNDEASVDMNIYNLLLDAWCCRALFIPQRQQQNQKQRQQQQQSRDDNVNSININNMASQRARELLVVLQENYERQVHATRGMGLSDTSSSSPTTSFLQPNERSFSMVFDAVLKVEGPTVARRIVAWMEFIYRKGRNDLARPTRRYYVRLLHAYADRSMPELAESILAHMQTTADEHVDTYCYNIALKAWSKRGGRAAAEHCDRLLEKMTAPKDIVTYSTAMSVWSKSGMKAHAVTRVEELLGMIEQDEGLEINTIVVNTVMSAWVKSRNPNASKRTAELLAYLESDSTTAEPDVMTYNNHIHALTLSPSNAKRAEELLTSLIKKSKKGEINLRPNTFSFNLILSAWAERHDYEAAWNAVRLLRKMIHRKDYPAPDTYSFNQVLKALSRSRRVDSAKLAEQLLTTMEEGHETKLFRNAKPDVASYTSVILALSRSGESDAAERGERILARSRAARIKPTTVMYNALITLWGKSGRGTYGARRAEQLLDEMKIHGVEPNTVSYNTVMDSWSRSGTRCCGNKAEGYLELLLSNKSVKPDKVSFNTCLNALSRSHNQGKAQRALRLLRRMIKLFPETGARPDVVSYTSVLNAAKRSNRSMDQIQRTRNLDTARHTLNELRESRWDHPNEHSYMTFIQACYGQSDDTIFREVLDDMFELCCEDGQVGEKVLSVIHRVAPSDFIEKHNLVDVTWEELPASWRRNTLRQRHAERMKMKKN